MEETPPSLQEFARLLRREIASLQSPRRRAFIERRLVEPHQVTIHWEYGHDEPYLAWTFADMGERDVVAQYCLGGFGAMGAPWGINFRSASHFGMDFGWYRSLDELVNDWGVEE
jgi:hypothetical protein